MGSLGEILRSRWQRDVVQPFVHVGRGRVTGSSEVKSSLTDEVGNLLRRSHVFVAVLAVDIVGSEPPSLLRRVKADGILQGNLSIPYSAPVSRRRGCSEQGFSGLRCHRFPPLTVSVSLSANCVPGRGLGVKPNPTPSEKRSQSDFKCGRGIYGVTQAPHSFD